MTSQLEPELVLYGRLTDFKQLGQALSVERHEQYELKILTQDNEPRKRVRVRKTISKGRVNYDLTTKVGDPAPVETTEPTTIETFNAFKRLQRSGMYKDRYRFPYGSVAGETLYWEIDVYIDRHTGLYHPWVKIDLEFPVRKENEVYAAVIPDNLNPLPIEIHDLMNNLQDNPAMKAKIQELYTKYFFSEAVD